jgi:hypothetical protein
LRDTLPGLAELTIEAERGAARRRFDVWTAPTAGLRRTIFDLAQVEWQARYEEFLAGRGATDVLLAAGHRRRDAALALAETAAARRALLEDHWRWCWSAEAIALARHHSGRVTIQELLAVRFERLLAELDLKTAGN